MQVFNRFVAAALLLIVAGFLPYRMVASAVHEGWPRLTPAISDLPTIKGEVAHVSPECRMVIRGFERCWVGIEIVGARHAFRVRHPINKQLDVVRALEAEAGPIVVRAWPLADYDVPATTYSILTSKGEILPAGEVRHAENLDRWSRAAIGIALGLLALGFVGWWLLGELGDLRRDPP